MGYKIGVDKKQIALLPVSLDEYIPEEHICRVITAFTEQIDMAGLGYTHAECKDIGCRPYDPRMMLNLYLYGYLYRVRSSRRLRDEARRNVEVMWLMNGLTPDDKTICNFRTDNLKALEQTFREFVRMCRMLGLYGEELVAVDGTKFRANNSLKNHWNETVVQNELGRIQEKVNEYLKALEEGDKEEAGKKEPERQEIRAALEQLKERKAKFEELKERVSEEGEVSTVDPDARMMHTGGDGRKLDVGYNVQTVVDSKYHMIVDFEVTNCSNDVGTLHEMTENAKEILEVSELTALADKGYYDSEDIAACEGSGVTCLVAKKKPGGAVKTKEFSHDRFVYNPEENEYVCPCGNRMRKMREAKKNGGKSYVVYANYEACRKCPRKEECTNYAYREIWRLPCQDVMDKVDERTRSNKDVYRKRQEIVEHVFGTVKAVWGYKQYLCRTKPKVTAETALAYLAYNMRRVFNIFTEARIKPVFG
jgi:transposase